MISISIEDGYLTWIVNQLGFLIVPQVQPDAAWVDEDAPQVWLYSPSGHWRVL